METMSQRRRRLPRIQSWVAAAVVGIGSGFLIWPLAASPGPSGLCKEVTLVKSSRHTPKPDETVSVAIGKDRKKTGQAAGMTKNDSGEATDSHRPVGIVPAPVEQERYEEILEREPDGRYRIIRRKPRDQ